jgi:ribosomal protein L11 methyltransferase
VKGHSLWKICVTTLPEAEEAIVELVGRTFGQPASSYTSLETGATTVTAYFEEKPDWPGARREGLKAGLAQVKAWGLDIGAGEISLSRMRREDWAESWKRHFRPIEIGSALLLKPAWSHRRARKGQAVVVLDPGLSFGTGQHPTTAFCLRQLVARRNPGKTQSFLDIGTGSGILAIAAAKLGYAPVQAFDFDPEAVRTAQGNARKNRVGGRIRFSRQDLTKLPRQGCRKYSLVCANLVSDLLVAERERILSRVQADGVLVIAGMLKAECAWVQGAYEAAGLRLVASRTQNEWQSGSFDFFE